MPAPKASRRTRQPLPTKIERVTFVIQAENRKEVLAQVVLRFQSLNVEMDALYMVRRRGSESMRVDITIQANREGSRVVEADLRKITTVRSVRTERGTKQTLDEAHHTSEGSPSLP